MTDYGRDIRAATDLDPSFALVEGRALLVEALRWRFMTPRGALFYDPSYGLDLRSRVADVFTEPDALDFRRAIVAEALKDRRIESASATVAFDRTARRLAVRVSLVDGAGPFAVVFAVTADTVSTIVQGVK